jgi:hypothetical protein
MQAQRKLGVASKPLTVRRGAVPSHDPARSNAASVRPTLDVYVYLSRQRLIS